MYGFAVAGSAAVQSQQIELDHDDIHFLSLITNACYHDLASSK